MCVQWHIALIVSEGPGHGFTVGDYGTGASHGGEAGCEQASQVPPPAYGSFPQPHDFGSGGGSGKGTGKPGYFTLSHTRVMYNFVIKNFFYRDIFTFIKIFLFFSKYFHFYQDIFIFIKMYIFLSKYFYFYQNTLF